MVACILCDVIKDAIASLLVLQPLADEDTGRRGVELAAPQHPVAMSHVVLEGSIVNFTTGVTAATQRMTVNKSSLCLRHGGLLDKL